MRNNKLVGQFVDVPFPLVMEETAEVIIDDPSAAVPVFRIQEAHLHADRRSGCRCASDYVSGGNRRIAAAQPVGPYLRLHR